MTSARILDVVVRKHGYWQKFCPVILFEIVKDAEIGFHCAVLSFGLAVYLRMEGS